MINDIYMYAGRKHDEEKVDKDCACGRFCCGGIAWPGDAYLTAALIFIALLFIPAASSMIPVMAAPLISLAPGAIILISALWFPLMGSVFGLT